MEHEQIYSRIAAMGEALYDCADAPAEERSGVYGYFPVADTKLPGIEAPLYPSMPLYIGMTESSLAGRNHFFHSNSGFSSPRRSLGALLIEVLDLHPQPRPGRPIPSNITCFCFGAEGEARLSRWMKEHLRYGHIVTDAPKQWEAVAIKHFKPILNLTGWSNDHRSFIKQRRAACVALAKCSIS